MAKELLDKSQEFVRTDGRSQVVNLHDTFQPAKEKPINGNFHRHLDSMAHDFAGPLPNQYKLGEVAHAKRDQSLNKVLDKGTILALQTA